LWGGGQVLAKRGLEDTSLALFGFIRSGFALLFVIVFGLLTTGFPLPTTKFLIVAILGGVLDSFIGTLLYMIALKTSPAHEVVPLANTAPFWGVVAAVIFLGESPRFASFAAAVLVVLGAYFLASHRDRADEQGTRWGPWAALAAGVLWGIAEIVPTKYCLSHGMAPITYQLMLVAVSALSHGMGCVCTFEAPFEQLFLVLERNEHCRSHRFHKPLPRLDTVAACTRPSTGEHYFPGSRVGCVVRIPGQCSYPEGTALEAFRNRRLAHHWRGDAGYNSGVGSFKCREQFEPLNNVGEDFERIVKIVEKYR